MQTPIRHLLATLTIALCCCPDATAQTDVQPFRHGVTDEGVCYFLPKTRIKVVLTAQKSYIVPGEFASYAERYLRRNDAPRSESTEWTLQAIEMHPYGVPDSTRAYAIRLNPKTSAPLVSLTDDGLLLGINAAVAPEPPFVVPQGTAAPQPTDGRQYLTRDILAASSTAKMAQLTAEEIYDLKESRNALIRGEADNTPKDGVQLGLMLDNLDRQVAALEALFVGQTLSNTEVLTLDYEPPATIDPQGQRTMLCRFSRRLGLVDKDDLSGEPVWLTITPLDNLPEPAPSADEGKQGRHALLAKGKRAQQEQGVYVAQPLRARLTIATAKQTFCTIDTPVCQLGTTELLSAVLFNKHFDTVVTLYQHTGSVRQLSRLTEAAK